jgi:hypothetical protein
MRHGRSVEEGLEKQAPPPNRAKAFSTGAPLKESSKGIFGMENKDTNAGTLPVNLASMLHIKSGAAVPCGCFICY